LRARRFCFRGWKKKIITKRQQVNIIVTIHWSTSLSCDTKKVLFCLAFCI
jgi:hypothetical protein